MDRCYYLYAYYDKVCVNVVLTYITKEEGVKTIITPQFVDPDATYKDMLDSLQLPDFSAGNDGHTPSSFKEALLPTFFTGS